MSISLFRTTSELFARCSQELYDLSNGDRAPLRTEEFEAAETMIVEAAKLLAHLKDWHGGEPTTWVGSAQRTAQFQQMQSNGEDC